MRRLGTAAINRRRSPWAAALLATAVVVLLTVAFLWLVRPPGAGVGSCNAASVLPPCASGADVGVAYAHQLRTHCGIRTAYFDGRRWIASPVLGGLDRSPPGWRDPDYGPRGLNAENSARFTSSAGLVAEFRPLAEGEEYPWEPCYD